MYNIIEYGAVADGKTLNTSAIQAAIDACANNGGGKVVVPAGVFKTGTVWMRSHVELHLECGAVLLASDNMDDYNDIEAFEQNHRKVVSEGWVGKHLLIALEVNDISITGYGTFDGNCYAFVDDEPNGGGAYWWRGGTTKLKDAEKMRPGQLLCFVESQNIRISDVTIHNSPCWSCYLLGCEFVTIRGIKVNNPFNMMNSDGIDVDTSRFVTISDCIIITGDDSITLRCCEGKVKNKSIHCEFVTVTNCVIRSTVSAFRVGVGTGTIRHARFSNLTVDKVSKLIEFNTSYAKDGCAVIEDVNLSNVSCSNADRLIKINADHGGTVRNITLENIRAETTATSFIRCDDGTLENIKLNNVELYVSDRYSEMTPNMIEQRGSYLLEVKNGKRISLDNVKIHGEFSDCKGTFLCEDCDDIEKRDCNF